MALAPFFERIYGALGGHLSVSRDSLTAVLDNVTVGIRCGADLGANDDWIAELSTNILARLYPRLAISGAENRCAALRGLAQRINPQIEFTTDAPGAHTVCVGSPAGDGPILPSATGWVARVDHSRHRHSGPANPYSAAASAAMACAELFRRVFLKVGPEPDVSVSLLNYDRHSGSDLALPKGTLGDVAFVGVGAVGNAALWALARHSRIAGQLHLIDPEELTLLNLQRYVLGTLADVSRSKVALGQAALSGTHLSVELCKNSLQEFAHAKGGFDLPTIAISVDNIETRRSAQALLPRLIVNGWTGDAALGASWHVFSRDAACLACLYHPHGQGRSATEQAARALGLSHDRAVILWVTRQGLTEEDIGTAAAALGVEAATLEPWLGKPLGDLYTDVVCGAVPLDVAGVGRLETVPLAHQSVLAGVMMAAELVKRTLPKVGALAQAEAVVSWDNVLKAAPKIWRKPRAREIGCICTDRDYQAVYKAKWRKHARS